MANVGERVPADLVATLEADWLPEAGFFWKIRQGHFSSDAFEIALKHLQEISFEEDADLPRRVVSLLWYVPIFMQWQTERVEERGGDTKAYAIAILRMTEEVGRILGTP